MNILFLNSIGKTKWGGGEKWMINAGKGLKERGHQITNACIKNSVIEQRSIASGLNTWQYTISTDIAFWKIPTLKSYLKKNKIDVLVCCQNKDVKIGARAARQTGIKAIFARQGIQNLTNKKKYITPFTQYIDGIITNTKSIKHIYEDFGWFPENFIHVIYNGVEILKNIKNINLHDKYKLSHGCKIIFSSGRLDYQKGFDLLINIAKKAKEEGLDWQIIVAGEGKLFSGLQSLAEKKGVSDVIRFIGFTNEILSHLDASDVFVFPSRYEGMPNALLEAMSVGKASVATSVNGVPELVEDGKSGFLVESENTDQLYAKIKLLLEDHELNISMGEQAKNQVMTNFTIDKMIDNLEKLFANQINQAHLL